MKEVCLISGTQINEKVARMNAFVTLLIMLIFVLTGARWILLFLTVDFFLKGFTKSACSPISIVNRAFLRMMKVAPKQVNAGPKIFSAKVGFLICLLISVFYFMDLTLIANVLVAVLMFCAFLEAFFGYCVACKIYPFFIRD